MGKSEFRFSSRWLFFALVLPTVGCAGSPPSSSTPKTSTPVSVQLSQTAVTISPTAQQQFTAIVTGTTNTAVSWSVDGIGNGNTSVGTVNAGLYTGPSQAGSHVVMATSAADPTKSASANVSVKSGSIVLSPATANIEGGATQQFSAAVQGEISNTVTWSVDGTAGGNSTVGTIDASGLYTAPSGAGSHSIAATSAVDTAANASARVAVFTLTISPTSGVTVAPSATEQFTATLQGLSNSGVSWSVDGVANGNSTVGTISSAGLYTAPSAIGLHTVGATSVAEPSTSASTTKVTVINVAQTAVLTYHNDDARDGAYLEEVALAPSNVNSSQFGKLVSYPVDGQIYPQPLYLPQVDIPNQGLHDVVFVATENNSLYAFDADAASGSPTTFWHVNLGAAIPKFDAGGPWPNVGILSTPVIDASTNTIYVLAEVNAVSPPFWLHAIDVTTGADKLSPVGVTGTYAGDTLSPACYQRMGLALNPVSNLIYVAFGSCDNGWIFGYDKTTLAQKALFEDTSGAAGGGLWASGAAPAIDDKSGDVYLMSGVDSGDEQYITGSTMVGYNDCFLRLNADKLSVLDYFSPDDNYTLALNDVDLGSGGNILLPGSSTVPNIVAGGGKDGNIFVVNRDSMGGFNDKANNVLQTVHIGTTQYDNIFSTPVYWNGALYYHSNNDVLRAFSWTAGAASGQQLSTTSTSAGAAVFGMHGATASLSANGPNNGIIWEIDNSTYNNTDPAASGVAVLHAYDATNVATELYNSSQAGSRDTAGQALKLTVPTIANGRVFVPTATELDIYGLLGQ